MDNIHNIAPIIININKCYNEECGATSEPIYNLKEYVKYNTPIYIKTFIPASKEDKEITNPKEIDYFLCQLCFKTTRFYYKNWEKDLNGDINYKIDI